MSTDDTHTNHKHEPESMVVAFYRTCKHCGVVIEPEYCKECNGTGYDRFGWASTCCKGTGVKRWVKDKR